MKKALLLLLLMPTMAMAQIITTVAGTGVAGYSGDGGAATSAGLNNPNGICADAAGNIYISDCLNNRIRKINTGGIISTVAGSGVAGFSGDGGPATAASINHPGDVVADAAGNIYFSENGNHRIRKVNTSGVISTFAGNGIAGFAGDGGAATNARMNFPYGITIDATGNLYVAERDNQRIRKITPAGIISTFAGTGTGGYGGDGGAATAADLWIPTYVNFDAAGNLYISDNQNQRIRKVNTAGIITTFAGNGISGFSGDGGAATAAQTSYPSGMATDALGNTYFCDLNNKLRKVSSGGIISTFCGTGTAGFSGDGGSASAATLNQPLDVVYTSSGWLYIVDNINNRIRKIDIATNHVPVFTAGATDTLTMCESEVPVPINTLLSVSDIDAGQTETWSLVTAPAHGIAAVAYSAVSTGSTITPTGLTYAPATGYVGTDLFTVKIKDGIDSSIITINVTINPAPNAGVISGVDTVCAGASVTLTESVTGGVWGVTNTVRATVSGSGVVSGVSSGIDTVTYKVTNSCGSDTAFFPIYINSTDAGIISGIDSVCPGASVALSESATGGFWSESNSLIAIVNSSGLVTGIAPGRDTIVYTVVNSCGIESAIFPMHVKSYTDCHTGVAITYRVIDRIELYPNPAYSQLHVTSTEMISSIVISSVTGQLIMSRNCATEHEVIDVSGLANGMYLIKINGSEVRKFVKQ